MTKQPRSWTIFWLVLSQLALLLPPAWAQDQPFNQRDKDEIKRQAEKLVKLDLPNRINILVADDLNEADRRDIMLNCYTLSEQQLFVNDAVIVEDDVDPAQTGQGLKNDKPVRQYLNDLLSFYARIPDTELPSFVISNVRKSDVFVENFTSAYINVFYDSIFKGKHKSGRTYQTIHRVARLQATRIGKKWQVLISQITFERPGAGQTQTAGTVTAPTAATVAVVNTPPPPPLEIREPTAVFKQEDYDFTITIRSNRKALDVVKTGSPRVPEGQYRRRDDGAYELAGNSIRFDEKDKNKFTYTNRDRGIMGFVRLQPSAPKPDTVRAVAAKPLPDVVTPGYLPLDENQRKRKAETPVSTSTALAVATPKTDPPKPPAEKIVVKPAADPPKPAAEKPAEKAPQVAKQEPVAEKSKPIPDPPKPAADPPKQVTEKPKPVADPPKQVVSEPKLVVEKPKPDVPVSPPVEKTVPKPLPASPILAETPNATEKPLPKPIVQKPVAMSVSPALKKSLSGEQQRIVAGMRLRGWLQVVGGLAALGGSYVAYSGIKRDYDAYSTQMNALNAEYNLYRDLSRRDVPAPPNMLSLAEYGSPGLYGAYGGGAAGFGLTLNGIRTLLRAGKVGKKK